MTTTVAYNKNANYYASSTNLLATYYNILITDKS